MNLFKPLSWQQNTGMTSTFEKHTRKRLHELLARLLFPSSFLLQQNDTGTAQYRRPVMINSPSSRFVELPSNSRSHRSQCDVKCQAYRAMRKSDYCHNRSKHRYTFLYGRNVGALKHARTDVRTHAQMWARIYLRGVPTWVHIDTLGTHMSIEIKGNWNSNTGNFRVEREARCGECRKIPSAKVSWKKRVSKPSSREAFFVSFAIEACINCFHVANVQERLHTFQE